MRLESSEVAISAVLTQPVDDGHHHPVAYENRKLTAVEQAYPPHVPELLAMVHASRVFRHYLLGSGAPRPQAVLSDFTAIPAQLDLPQRRTPGRPPRRAPLRRVCGDSCGGGRRRPIDCCGGSAGRACSEGLPRGLHSARCTGAIGHGYRPS